MSSSSFVDNLGNDDVSPPSDGIAGGGSYTKYESRFQSQRFDSSFSNYEAANSVRDSTKVFSSEETPENRSPPSGETNGQSLTPALEMEREEGHALREWRRQNRVRLEEKERKEKERVNQIKEEAEQYKADFYTNRTLTLANIKKSSRLKQKLFMEKEEKFNEEAQNNYWKAIVEIIPREVPVLDKRGKKIAVIQGPKTDLSRMRQVLTKLKFNPPLHMKQLNS